MPSHVRPNIKDMFLYIYKNLDKCIVWKNKEL